MTTPLPRPVTAAGRAGLAAVLTTPDRTLLALDFDGTLAPIVADPEAARAHPRAVSALARLAPRLAGVAVLTGRPADVAVRYGGFAGVGGLEHLVVLGHYGLQRWEAATGAVSVGPAAGDVDGARGELPALLRELEVPDGTVIEDKGLAVAVHTRRAAEPDALLERLRAPLAGLAARHGLALEPGRRVLELRPAGMDKGAALRRVVAELTPACVVFAGDDLGDLAAFGAVEDMRSTGLAGLLVCSGSAEVEELAERADLVVDGPGGVVVLVESLADALAAPP